jgi:predicted secreted protein
VGQGPKRIVIRPPAKKQSWGWRLAPLLLLLLLLVAITIRDSLTSAPLEKTVAEGDQASENDSGLPPSGNHLTARNSSSGSVKVDIIDEPEERGPEAPLAVKVSIKNETEEGGAPAENGPEIPVDPTPRVTYEYEPRTMRVGITALKVRGRDGSVGDKQITYRKDGSTSNTRLKVDGKDGELGPPDGYWKVRPQDLPDDPKKLAIKRTQSVFVRRDIQVTQIIEVVASKQPLEIAPGVRKRLLDTVLVRYVIENKGEGAHRVGLRVMVDTYIGSNDGVPFAVPDEEGMVNTYADFTDLARASRQVPEFVQALERPDLQYPGTVAHMTLKLGGRMEPPNRVSLTRWPLSDCPWEVPLRPMEDDSAVAIYWFERLLEPGARRELGYGYGLGAVTSNEAGGKLGLTLGCSFEPGQIFTVTSYVTNPAAGQMLDLTLPDGLEVQGNPRLPVPEGKGTPPTSTVTWKVKVLQTGEFRLRVTSSTGISQSKTITIARPSGGRFVLSLNGSFAPGQVFTARATVGEPLPGQALKIILPSGLERVIGPEVAPVHGVPGTVEWQIKVLAPGKHRLRVQSSTGQTQTKTISIDPEAGQFVIEIAPAHDLAPGKEIAVRARVSNPLPGQRLTLELPEKLQMEEGEATQTVPSLPAGTHDGTATVTWRVRILDYGRLPVRVRSSTGTTRAKTINLQPGTIFGR